MGYHAANVMANNVNRFFDAEMILEKSMEVCSHDSLGISVAWMRGMAGSSIVRGNHSVPTFAEIGYHVPKLI